MYQSLLYICRKEQMFALVYRRTEYIVYNNILYYIFSLLRTSHLGDGSRSVYRHRSSYNVLHDVSVYYKFKRSYKILLLLCARAYLVYKFAWQFARDVNIITKCPPIVYYTTCQSQYFNMEDRIIRLDRIYKETQLPNILSNADTIRDKGK